MSCGYFNLEASEKGLAEYHKKSRVVFIPKSAVQSVEVQFGPRAERPRIQLAAGLVLVALGLVGLWMTVNGGIRGVYWGIGCVMFGGIGVLCLHEAVRKGHYLCVNCTNGTRKLVLRGEVDQGELSGFVREAASVGYRFTPHPQDPSYSS